VIVVTMTTSGCAAAPPSGTAHSSSVAHVDLSAVVYSPDAPPAGMTSDGGRDGEVLGRLPLSTTRSAELQDHPGFVNGRYATFSGSSGFLLSWAAQYASDEDAAGAMSIVLDELQSDDGYGWGIGEPANLGDEGTCLEGDNPVEGGLHETICVWRNASLLLVVGGDSTDTPMQSLAEEMDSRAEAALR
jgi:hypothetical protein